MARLIGSHRIICVAPKKSPSADNDIQFSVSENANQAEYYFTYLPGIAIVDVLPRHGPAGGGTLVLVRGSHFSARASRLGYALCRFNNSVSAAIFVSTNEAACYTPSISPGVVHLGFTNDGQDFSADVQTFSFVAMHVREVRPATGASSGGSRLAVNGRDFTMSGEVYCAFQFGELGETLTRATLLSSNLLTCWSPRHPPHVWPRSRDKSTVHLCFHEGRLRSTLAFIYVELADAVRLDPRSGPVDGGTMITIKGRDFAVSSKHHCAFKQKIAAAQCYSSSIITCASPAFAASDALLRINTDGSASYDTADLIFSFHAKLQARQLLPSAGPLRGGTVVHVITSRLLSSRTAATSTSRCAFNSTAIVFATCTSFQVTHHSNSSSHRLQEDRCCVADDEVHGARHGCRQVKRGDFAQPH
jgi:hypothetical protein